MLWQHFLTAIWVAACEDLKTSWYGILGMDDKYMFPAVVV